jgi:hypothetical protein
MVLYPIPPGYFTCFNATVVFRCALVKKMTFRLVWKCPSIHTRCHMVSHFLATSLPNPGLVKQLLTHWVPCNVMPLFEMLQPSVEAFKINSHLLGYFNTVCPATARPFFHVWQNHPNISYSILPCFASQFLIHFEILHLAQPAVNSNFVTMLIRVGVHKPGLFHFYSLQFCALL